jgi:hypothetical protein
MTKFEMDGEERTYLGTNDELGTCELDGGYWLRATTMKDPDGQPPDQMQEGFWPTLDPADPGYIGPKSKRTLRRRMAEAKEIMRLWQADDWWWVGVIVELYRRPEDEDAGTDLIGEAALWGIECNWPRFRGDRVRYDNSYLWTVANDLIQEAIDDAESNGHIPQVIAGVLKAREKHSEADALSAG